MLSSFSLKARGRLGYSQAALRCPLTAFPVMSEEVMLFPRAKRLRNDGRRGRRPLEKGCRFQNINRHRDGRLDELLACSGRLPLLLLAVGRWLR